MGKTTSYGFDNPFPRNHCVPLAFTVLSAEPSAEAAVKLAAAARKAGLLTARGGSINTSGRASRWAALAGLQVVEEYRPTVEYRTSVVEPAWSRAHYRSVQTGRPTLAQFLRGKGRRGRWLIITRGHGQAAINGRVKGYSAARSRVLFACRVKPLDK